MPAKVNHDLISRLRDRRHAIVLISLALMAVIHPTFDRARKEADAADSLSAKGPFAGIPFLLKDAGGEQAGEFCM